MIRSPSSSEHESEAVDLLLDAEQKWSDALLAAGLLALNGKAFGGVHITGGPSPARDLWLSIFARLAGQAPLTLSGFADDETIEGGADLLSGLMQRTLVRTKSLPERAGSRPVLIRAAEQLQPAPLHALTRQMDEGVLPGGLILFDDGDDDSSGLDPLCERAAFGLRLDGIPMGMAGTDLPFTEDLALARELFLEVALTEEQTQALSTACLAYGIQSFRPVLFAIDAARGLAALNGRSEPGEEDITAAARLVIAPRAVRSPPASENDDTAPSEEAQPEESPSETEQGRPDDIQAIEDAVLEAVAAGLVTLSLPEGAMSRAAGSPKPSGKRGRASPGQGHGRQIGAVPGRPMRGGRLDVVATLKAAAPWQRLRPAPTGGTTIRIYPSDLRIRKFSATAGTSVIFVVDASGSAAMHRLAEAKGAVEALLAECYSRRDTVSLIVFRGTQAERVLEPSRSLTRARRARAGLPGGGGTPLPSAIRLAVETAIAERWEGRTPLLVYLTDGKGNIALRGNANRGEARAEAVALAQRSAGEGIDSLFFDTAPRPQQRAAELAAAMGARYHPLPYADGSLVGELVENERSQLRRGQG
jgi:magnesium chelatase subunit D